MQGAAEAMCNFIASAGAQLSSAPPFQPSSHRLWDYLIPLDPRALSVRPTCKYLSYKTIESNMYFKALAFIFASAALAQSDPRVSPHSLFGNYMTSPANE